MYEQNKQPFSQAIISAIENLTHSKISNIIITIIAKVNKAQHKCYGLLLFASCSGRVWRVLRLFGEFWFGLVWFFQAGESS